MHPTLTQTPPSLSRSMTAVDRPSCAARIAQTYPPGPPPTMMTSKFATMGPLSWHLPNHRQGILEHAFEGLQETGAGSAVDDPVIAAHGHAHAPPHGQGSLVRHRLLLHRSHGQDTRLGRVDDRGNDGA